MIVTIQAFLWDTSEGNQVLPVVLEHLAPMGTVESTTYKVCMERSSTAVDR